MSVMYATVNDLGSYLQIDLSAPAATAAATLAIQTASQMFSTRANTMFAPTTLTYQVIGLGYRQLQLPFRPVTAVSAVRIVSAVAGNTTTITDYSRIKTVLYRLIGFGAPGVFPPDMVEVDLTHGYATAGDDVKGVVLESAAMAYEYPDPATKSESIDDYSVSTAPNLAGIALSATGEKLAELYRGTIAA